MWFKCIRSGGSAGCLPLFLSVMADVLSVGPFSLAQTIPDALAIFFCCLLVLPCYIPISVEFIHVFSTLDLVWLYLFSLSPSLYSLCPVSLSFSSFNRPTPSRRFSCSRFLPVKREFFLATALTWEFRLWVSDSVKHLETLFFLWKALTNNK